MTVEEEANPGDHCRHIVYIGLLDCVSLHRPSVALRNDVEVDADGNVFFLPLLLLFHVCHCFGFQLGRDARTNQWTDGRTTTTTERGGEL